MIQGYSWRRKPPLGWRINPDHPWAQGLAWFGGALENGGTITCDSVSGMPLTLAGGASWAATSKGSGISCVGNNARAQATWPTGQEWAFPLTFAVAFHQVGAPSGSPPYLSLAPEPLVVLNGGGANGMGIYPNDNVSWWSGFVPANGSDSVFAATVNKTTQPMYANGLARTAGTGTYGTTNYSSTNIAFGDSSSYSGRNPNAIIYWGGIWRLSPPAAWAEEITADVNAIWDIFQSPISYFLFQSGLSITESGLPTYQTSGTATIHVVGTGTSWTSGTTFSTSGVAGWSVASVDVVNGTHATITLNCPPSGGVSGTLVVATGSLSVSAHVGASSMSCSPAIASANDSLTVTLTGTNTLWLTAEPAFMVSGGNSPSISNITYASNTQATATIFASAAPGAAITITDPLTGATATITTSNTVNTTAYVTKNGLILFAAANSANQPVAVTAVSSNPTISVNGSPITCQGPFWKSTLGGNQVTPFVIYQPLSAITSAETVTFAASAGWYTAGGMAATVYYQGAVSSYVGELEPPLYGYTAFNYLPTNATNPLAIGFNGPTFASNQTPFGLNLLKRGNYFGGGWTNIGSFDGSGTGHPATITGNGQSSLTPVDSGVANLVDNSAYPDLVGTYVLVLDDTYPTAPMKAYASVNAVCATIASGPTAPAGATTAGTLTDGVLVGQTWTWVITRNSNATQYNLGLTITLCSEYEIASVYQWTATNEWLFGADYDGGTPSNTSRANPVAASPNFLNRVNQTNNIGPSQLRYLPGNWWSSQVDVEDMRNLTDFQWTSPLNTYTASVTAIRPYSLTNSPYVYVSNNYSGSTANPDVTPPNNLAYYFTPSNTTWSNLSTEYNNASQSWLAEFVTAEPHGFKTGWSPVFSGTMPTLSVTNGEGSPINITLTSGLQAISMYITSATTFVILFASNSLTANGAETNNVASQYNIPGGSPLTVTVSTPFNPGQQTGATLPWEFVASAAGQLNNCNYYCNIPLTLTDAAVTTAAERILEYLPRGASATSSWRTKSGTSGPPRTSGSFTRWVSLPALDHGAARPGLIGLRCVPPRSTTSSRPLSPPSDDRAI